MTEWLLGRHSVEEALAAGSRKIFEIAVRTGARDAVGERLSKLAAKRGVAIQAMERDQFDELAPRGTGVVARCSDFDYVDASQLPDGVGNRLVVVLDGIQDPQNLGAIVRTAEVAGADALCIATRRAAQVTPAAVRASAGATEHLSICRTVNIARLLGQLRERGYWTVGLAPEGGESWSAVDYRGPIALVVGSEGQGLRRLVASGCDHLVALPGLGKTQSLNASAAFSAVAFEVLRQRAR
ncbi:MAG: 23S rRNA (guanosine(2251)-2'-O)-methyltransferase RlmB [Acidobacteria bacterium]|nr:23S rRNA (guanosine(2251)-2'-O)-methyltransferase RlmB [Acidobacteriota bacterium]